MTGTPFDSLLQRHIMAFLLFARRFQSFEDLLFRSTLLWTSQSLQRERLLHQDVYSLYHFLWRWSWWWFESSHMPRNCWSIHKTMKKFHLKENLMLNQLCHLSPQWTQSSFTQWTKFTIKSHYFFFAYFGSFLTFSDFVNHSYFLWSLRPLWTFTTFMDLYGPFGMKK